MAFSWGKKKPKFEENLSERDIDDRLAELTHNIKRLEDAIYGVALYFEGLSLMHAGQADVLETYQKQFRNIIQADSDTLAQARKVFEMVEKDRSQANILTRLSIVPCRGHTNPAEMERRAVVLVERYNHLFPNRPRSRDFTEEETMQLTEEAAEAFAAVPSAPAASV